MLLAIAMTLPALSQQPAAVDSPIPIRDAAQLSGWFHSMPVHVELVQVVEAEDRAALSAGVSAQKVSWTMTTKTETLTALAEAVNALPKGLVTNSGHVTYAAREVHTGAWELRPGTVNGQTYVSVMDGDLGLSAGEVTWEDVQSAFISEYGALDLGGVNFLPPVSFSANERVTLREYLNRACGSSFSWLFMRGKFATPKVESTLIVSSRLRASGVVDELRSKSAAITGHTLTP